MAHQSVQYKELPPSPGGIFLGGRGMVWVSSNLSPVSLLQSYERVHTLDLTSYREYTELHSR